MDGPALFRRAFHVASPLFLAYYLLPDPIGGNVSRTSAALLFVGTAACIEIARIALGVKLFGLRPYEGNRVSAYAQGLLGLAFGIFVIQDLRIVVPVFLGMAWIDPLSAYCRKAGKSRVIPAAAYFGLILGTVLAAGWFYLPNALLFASAATAVGIVVEGPKIPQVDDDLLMQVVPMVVLYFLLAGFGIGFGASR
ncbi:MAG TPA: hypothetical protein VI999_07265 [Thermoplasmata archaeon]|nr:hypothetical protein [Thermoplasmata archaeon]